MATIIKYNSIGKMKILILSYLYYPDISAGAFRMKALVDIKSQVDKKNEHSFTILCSNSKKSAYIFEKKNNIEIIKINVPFFGKGFLSLSLSYLIFLCLLVL